MDGAKRGLGRYLSHAVGVTLLALLVGAWPAWALAGRAGLQGLGAGAFAALVGAILGHLPRLFLRRGPDALFAAGLAGVGIRLLATLVLAGVLLFTTPFPREPLGIGLVLTYLALLALEVRELVALGRGVPGSGGEPREPADGTPNR